MKTNYPKNQMPFEIWSNYIKTMAKNVETNEIPFVFEKVNKTIKLIQFSHAHHVDFTPAQKHILTTGQLNGEWFIGVNRSMIYDKMQNNESSVVIIHEIELEIISFCWQLVSFELKMITDHETKKYFARQLKKYFMDQLDKNVKF